MRRFAGKRFRNVENDRDHVKPVSARRPKFVKPPGGYTSGHYAGRPGFYYSPYTGRLYDLRGVPRGESPRDVDMGQFFAGANLDDGLETAWSSRSILCAVDGRTRW